MVTDEELENIGEHDVNVLYVLKIIGLIKILNL
jgi:hypothetical protein